MVGKNIDAFPRPSHADRTYLEKYIVNSSSGEGRSSARETVGRVAAGTIADKHLRVARVVEFVAFTSSVGSRILFPPRREHPTAANNPAALGLINGMKRERIDKFYPCDVPTLHCARRWWRKWAWTTEIARIA